MHAQRRPVLRVPQPGLHVPRPMRIPRLMRIRFDPPPLPLLCVPLSLLICSCVHRWRMWEEQIKVKYGVSVLPLAADLWQVAFCLDAQREPLNRQVYSLNFQLFVGLRQAAVWQSVLSPERGQISHGHAFSLSSPKRWMPMLQTP